MTKTDKKHTVHIMTKTVPLDSKDGSQQQQQRPRPREQQQQQTPYLTCEVKCDSISWIDPRPATTPSVGAPQAKRRRGQQTRGGGFEPYGMVSLSKRQLQRGFTRARERCEKEAKNDDNTLAVFARLCPQTRTRQDSRGRASFTEHVVRRTTADHRPPRGHGAHVPTASTPDQASARRRHWM